MATNIDRAVDGTVTFDFGVGIDPIVLTDSNNIVVSSSETKNSLGVIIRQDLSFMREDPYFFYSMTYSQIGTINGVAKPAIGEDTTTLLQTEVFQGTGGAISPEVQQALDAKANLEGGNEFSGSQTFDTGIIVGDIEGNYTGIDPSIVTTKTTDAYITMNSESITLSSELNQEGLLVDKLRIRKTTDTGDILNLSFPTELTATERNVNVPDADGVINVTP